MTKEAMNPPATSPPDALPDADSATRLKEILEQLKKLERRDWWLWIVAILVMSLLTLAVISMSFPDLLKTDDPFFKFSLNQAMRGLVGLVFLFNTYSIYQQVTIKRTRGLLSKQIEDMGKLQMRADIFYKQATTDPLTDLANRRTAEQHLFKEVSRARRYGRDLTLVAFDLNNFKQINDRYGHAAGDLVLTEFAAKLAAATRLSDLAVRMGGDEFLLILAECPTKDVPILVGRLRPCTVNFHGVSIPVEFSAGCVGYQKGETSEQFLERADRTLYADKRAGKVRSALQPALR
jgi:diguanylate cyclase (GGDEF)-like protein